MDPLDQMTSALAATIGKGSPPDKPDPNPIPRFFTGTVAGGVSGGKLPVRLVGANADGSDKIQYLNYLLTGRTPANGETVLVMQLPHQRFVWGAISQ